MTDNVISVPRLVKRRRVLLICGSSNQTTQMHKIAQELPYETYYSPYYASGFVDFLLRAGLGEMTIGGHKMVQRCLEYLEAHNLRIDYRGRAHDYDLVITCQDQITPRNILDKKVVLVQEGMIDPPTMLFRLSKVLRFVPRFMAGTAATGQSLCFERFCVASPGFKDYFVSHGIPAERIVVTGIPNFDDCASYLENDFPHRGYVFVATSDMRETFKYDNRRKFIERAVEIADGRQLIFKLHPNENERSVREIQRYAPDALVYTTGNAEQMVANADVVICQFSSLAFVGLALKKEVHSHFNLDELRALQPIQNACAATKIADVCMEVAGGLPRSESRDENPRSHSSEIGIPPPPRQSLLAARR